jgi:hypothetical protein
VTTDESTREEAAPDPDDPGKPDSPTDLTKRSALYVVCKTAREFSKDQCTDLAAALTYYAVLSMFPVLVVIVSCWMFSARVNARLTRSCRSWETSPLVRQWTRYALRLSNSSSRLRPASRSLPALSVRCGPRLGTSEPSAGR